MMTTLLPSKGSHASQTVRERTSATTLVTIFHSCLHSSAPQSLWLSLAVMITVMTGRYCLGSAQVHRLIQISQVLQMEFSASRNEPYRQRTQPVLRTPQRLWRLWNVDPREPPDCAFRSYPGQVPGDLDQVGRWKHLWKSDAQFDLWNRSVPSSQ